MKGIKRSWREEYMLYEVEKWRWYQIGTLEIFGLNKKVYFLVALTNKSGRAIN